MQNSIIFKNKTQQSIYCLIELIYDLYFWSLQFNINKLFYTNIFNNLCFLIYNHYKPFFNYFNNNYCLLNFDSDSIENFSTKKLLLKSYKLPHKLQFVNRFNKFLNLYHILIFYNSWVWDYSVGNPHFYSMFIRKKNMPPVINANIFLKKWADTTNFLINFFCYNPTLLVFSTPFFKHETLALNWFYNNFELNFWKFHSNLFFRQKINFSHKTEYFYQRLYEWNYETTVVTDIDFHKATLFYLNRFYFFSIALVDTSNNPLKVSFPIIILQINHLIQFFFLKLLVQSFRLAKTIQYTQFMKFWKSFHLLSCIKKYQTE